MNVEQDVDSDIFVSDDGVDISDDSSNSVADDDGKSLRSSRFQRRVSKNVTTHQVQVLASVSFLQINSNLQAAF